MRGSFDESASDHRLEGFTVMLPSDNADGTKVQKEMQTPSLSSQFSFFGIGFLFFLDMAGKRKNPGGYRYGQPTGRGLFFL